MVLGETEILQNRPARLSAHTVVVLLPGAQQQIVISRLVKKSKKFSYLYKIWEWSSITIIH